MSDSGVMEREKVAETSGQSTRWKFLEKLRRKPQIGPTIESVSPGEPAPKLEPEPPPVEEPQEEKVPESENLRPSRKIFFHTTPEGKLPGIRKSGLFMDQRDSGIADRLAYSLYFGFEHAVLRKDLSALGKLSPRDYTPDEYVLTVWKKGKQVMRRGEDYKRSGLLQPREAGPEGFIPPEFAEANPDKPSYAIEKIGNISPDSLLGSIKLTKEVREGFLKQMILADIGKIDANQFEENLVQIMEGNSQMENGTDLRDLAHDLAVSLEHEMIRASVVPAAKKIDENSEILPFYNRGIPTDYFGDLAQAYWLTFARRFEINDPVSARYLDGLIKFLDERIINKGYDLKEVNAVLKKKLEILKTPDTNTKGSLRGPLNKRNIYSTTVVVVTALEKEMGLS